MPHTEATDALRQQYSRHEWTPVSMGCSGATVHQLEGPGNLYVKIARVAGQLDSGYHLSAEADRLGWLGNVGIPVPEVVEKGTSGDYAWLGTTEVPGRSAAARWPADQRERVIDAFADVTQALHGLPVDDCPYDRSLAVTMLAAEQAVHQDLVDLDRLNPAHAGWTPFQLLENAYATVPSNEELVVGHGDLCLPNVILDPDNLAVTGLIDVGRVGRADRYADLALASRSIAGDQNPQYISQHADRYLARYGVEPIDTDRITFYRLLDEFF